VKIVAIIQARMGSTRLPGKVLRPLAGQPVLWHIVHRLRKCSMVDEIAIATSVESVDDPLVSFAEQLGVQLVRGPEDNVLERFEVAVDQLQPDVVLRVTGDAPLIDPVMVDRLLCTLLEQNAGYCTVDPALPCIHEGIDPFTTWAFRKLVTEARADPIAREHLTTYFKEHPDFVPIAYAELPKSEQFSGARISLDTPADFQFLEAIHTELGASAGELDIREVVSLLRRKPELMEINRHVHQKGSNEQTKRIVIRCDGGRRVGLGHVVRCLALADELREHHAVGITFAMLEDDVGIGMVKDAGYPVQQGPSAAHEACWLEDTIRLTKADTLIMDFRTDLSREHVERWRAAGLLIVTIDDPSDRRLASDLAFYPPVPQVERMDWAGFTGQLHCGWEWVILRRQFSDMRTQLLAAPDALISRQSNMPMILVAMGGSDSVGLTLRAVDAMKQLEDPFRAVFVLGRAFCRRGELDHRLTSIRFPVEIRTDVRDIASLMLAADMAVASFGITAYELAAVGVPGIYIPLTSDHCLSCSAFEESGIGIGLGLNEAMSTGELACGIRLLLRNTVKRTQMHERCLRVLDGVGAERVASMCVM